MVEIKLNLKSFLFTFKYTIKKAEREKRVDATKRHRVYIMWSVVDSSEIKWVRGDKRITIYLFLLWCWLFAYTALVYESVKHFHSNILEMVEVHFSLVVMHNTFVFVFIKEQLSRRIGKTNLLFVYNITYTHKFEFKSDQINRLPSDSENPTQIAMIHDGKQMISIWFEENTWHFQLANGVTAPWAYLRCHWDGGQDRRFSAKVTDNFQNRWLKTRPSKFNEF